MKMKISLLCLFAVGCAQTDLTLDQGEQEAFSNPYPTTPSSTSSISWASSSGTPFPVVAWTSTQPVRWPASAAHMQVFMRTGSINAFGTVTSFYVFVVGDGNRLDSVYRVRTMDRERFLAALNTTFDTAEVPGSSRTYGVNGGIYTGPKIGVGPAGEDPPSAIPSEYVSYILRSAAVIQDAALQTSDVVLVR